MNSCNFLVNIVSNNNAKQSDVEELKAKLESLTTEVSTLKEMVILIFKCLNVLQNNICCINPTEGVYKSGVNLSKFSLIAQKGHGPS